MCEWLKSCMPLIEVAAKKFLVVLYCSHLNRAKLFCLLQKQAAVLMQVILLKATYTCACFQVYPVYASYITFCSILSRKQLSFFYSIQDFHQKILLFWAHLYE